MLHNEGRIVDYVSAGKIVYLRWGLHPEPKGMDIILREDKQFSRQIRMQSNKLTK